MLDRRTTPRLRSFKGARIIFHSHWPAIDCTVRTLSGTGACVKMQGEFNTALQFELTFLLEKETRACRQVWQQGHRIGVAFG